MAIAFEFMPNFSQKLESDFSRETDGDPDYGICILFLRIIKYL